MATNREYDARFGYQFMEALRNYSQHGGLPLHGASYGTRRREGKEEGMLQYSVATHVMVDRLRGNKSFKQAVLKDVTEDKLSAEPLLRDYIEGLSCIHMELRQLLKERVEGWMKTVRDTIAEFVSGSPDGSTLGLCAMQLGKRNEWLETVPLVEDMLERVEILQKRNGSLQRLTSSFVSSAPRNGAWHDAQCDQGLSAAGTDRRQAAATRCRPGEIAPQRLMMATGSTRRRAGT